MEELKVGDKITVRVEILKIIVDKEGKHYGIWKGSNYMNSMIIEPKDIVE